MKAIINISELPGQKSPGKLMEMFEVIYAKWRRFDEKILALDSTVPILPVYNSLAPVKDLIAGEVCVVVMTYENLTKAQISIVVSERATRDQVSSWILLLEILTPEGIEFKAYIQNDIVTVSTGGVGVPVREQKRRYPPPKPVRSPVKVPPRRY